MKRFLLLIIFLIFMLPVYSADLDVKGRLKFGKEVSITLQENTVLSANFDEYLNNLSENLRKRWNPPNHNKDLRVVLRISIHNDGSLKSMKVIRTSGFNNVDRSALALIQENSSFASFPSGAKEQSLNFIVTLDRYILGHPTIKANDTMIVLSERSLKDYTYLTLNSEDEKGVCKDYLKTVTKSLKESLILSNHPRILMSYFKFDITRSGQIANIEMTRTSGDKNFNNEILEKLQASTLPEFPAELSADKITVEYRIGNNPSQRPRYNPVKSIGTMILGVPL